MVRLVSTPTGAPLPSRRLRGEAVLADPLVRELLEARLVASLATLEPDGSVHLVAIWFALAGDAVLLATGSGSRKVANLVDTRYAPGRYTARWDGSGVAAGLYFVRFVSPDGEKSARVIVSK